MLQVIDSTRGLSYFVTRKGSNFIAGRSSLRCVQNHIRSPGSHKGMRQRIPLLLSETLPNGKVYA
ncbi:hypothetical protein MYA98_19165 [Salmonella sp. WGH-01]|nr:hypothetical protein MYA98_19165 [Salmonella sp. WGH-01]